MEIREGFKKTEVGVIPSDWNVYRLKQNSTLKARIGWQGLTTAEYLDNGEFFLVTGTDFFDGRIKWGNCHFISESRYMQDPFIQLRKDDILVTKDGTIGKVAYIDTLPLPATLNSGVFVIRPQNADYYPRFFFYLLKSKYFTDFLNQLVAGSTISHLYQKDFIKFNFPLPIRKKEQIVITESLANTDALISSLEKLIAKKRNIKQGAMQELLKPKVGWEVKTIKSIADVGRGRVISHKEIAASVQGKYPVYSSQTSNNGIMGYIDTYEFEGEYVTWTTDGVNAGTVFYRNGRFNCTNVCGTIKLKSDCPQFVALLLNTITPKYVSRNLANPKLMNDPVKRIEIQLPSVEEQKAIAAILYDMEAEITALGTKLEKYKRIKQGMMQTLLTGQIRLI